MDEGLPVPPSRWQRTLQTLRHTSFLLFPHLHNFSNKSILSILVAVFATPGVLALTTTLPVVLSSYGETHVPRSDEAAEGRLVDFEEDGIERVLVAEDELKDELYEPQFNKWLTALQCVLGPVLCVLLVLGTSISSYARKYNLTTCKGTHKSAFWYLLAAAATGISTGALVLVFADKGDNVAGRLTRCFMGFVVAVVWIMEIADEVVSVLKVCVFPNFPIQQA